VSADCCDQLCVHTRDDQCVGLLCGRLPRLYPVQAVSDDCKHFIKTGSNGLSSAWPELPTTKRVMCGRAKLMLMCVLWCVLWCRLCSWSGPCLLT